MRSGNWICLPIENLLFLLTGFLACYKMACVKCNRSILSDENHYIASDLGPEIIFIIEQDRGQEVAADAALCEACFNSAANLLESTHSSTEGIQNPTTRSDSGTNDTNECVWCLVPLLTRRTHYLTSGPQRDAISNIIAPRQVPDGGLVCHRCWTRACRLVGASTSNSGQSQHICVLCRRSLSRRRTHIISHGPERDDITAQIAPRQILPGDRVCYACWVSARRNVQRATNPHLNVCIVCSTSTVRRRTHLLVNGPVRDVISRRIRPRQITNHPLVCNDCWTWAQDAVHQANEQPDQPNQEEPEQVLDMPHRIQLNTYKKIGTSSSSCFVPGCTNTERHVVPSYLRKNILSNYKIYIAQNARVCMIHKTTYDWDHIILNLDMLNNVFSADDIEKMMQVNNDSHTIYLNFSNLENIDDSMFHYWTGLTKHQFLSVLNEIPQLAENCKMPKTALGLFLVKARTGDSHERLGTLFRMSKATVTRLLKKAREALLSQYVPAHLGLGHISREDIINKNLLIPEGLFGNREERKPIIIFDGTYIYSQKSSNYLYQKMTFSLHKHRNLVKPFLLVATDGHIIDVCGPYPATMSDADIMTLLFENENGPYRQYFRPDDILILDRGFRDALPLLENIYKVCKPESLEAGQTQLSTINANKSRLVTLCGWVVDVVHGRFKLQFKLFRQEYFNVASSHLMDDFKICAAILNAFHSPLVDRPDAEAILSRAQQRVNLPNALGNFIVENNINRQIANFSNIDANHPLLEVFPQMTNSDLILLALGIYQIKQARSYFGEHIKQNGSFLVELCCETMIPGTLSSHETILIRGRIKYRHRSNKIYYSYILISTTQGNWENSLEGYYCSCICGMRTVGCCAHVMTIVWYLGWARYQNNVVAPASFLDDVLVREEE